MPLQFQCVALWCRKQVHPAKNQQRKGLLEVRSSKHTRTRLKTGIMKRSELCLVLMYVFISTCASGIRSLLKASSAKRLAFQRKLYDTRSNTEVWPPLLVCDSIPLKKWCRFYKPTGTKLAPKHTNLRYSLSRAMMSRDSLQVRKQ